MAGTFSEHAPQLQWKPLARMRTHEQVVAEIEHRLVVGTLKAGDRLPPERQFAEALGVSRGAVREALRILEAIGVVEAATGTGPASGSRIVSDSVAGVALVLRIHMQLASFSEDDLTEVRTLIEQVAARKAAERATDDDITVLRALVANMRDARTPAAYNDFDAAFHARLVQASGNGLSAVLMAALRDAQRRIRSTEFESWDDFIGNVVAVTGEYDAIIDAIEAGNGGAAADLTADQLANAGRESALKRAG
jgi:GntR family transcriptional repressor for pyruvate dehydrogenase complex